MRYHYAPYFRLRTIPRRTGSSIRMLYLVSLFYFTTLCGSSIVIDIYIDADENIDAEAATVLFRWSAQEIQRKDNREYGAGKERDERGPVRPTNRA